MDVVVRVKFVVVRDKRVEEGVLINVQCAVGTVTSDARTQEVTNLASASELEVDTHVVEKRIVLRLVLAIV